MYTLEPSRGVRKRHGRGKVKTKGNTATAASNSRTLTHLHEGSNGHQVVHAVMRHEAYFPPQIRRQRVFFARYWVAHEFHGNWLCNVGEPQRRQEPAAVRWVVLCQSLWRRGAGGSWNVPFTQLRGFFLVTLGLRVPTALVIFEHSRRGCGGADSRAHGSVVIQRMPNVHADSARRRRGGRRKGRGRGRSDVVGVADGTE